MRLPRRRANKVLLFVGGGVLLLAFIGTLLPDPKTPTAASPGPTWAAQPSSTNPPPATTEPAPTRPAAPKPSSTGRRTTTPPPKRDPRFSTCKQAKAHGYGPYYRGKDPEYGWYIDSDRDGVVCE